MSNDNQPQQANADQQPVNLSEFFALLRGILETEVNPSPWRPNPMVQRRDLLAWINANYPPSFRTATAAEGQDEL